MDFLKATEGSDCPSLAATAHVAISQSVAVHHIAASALKRDPKEAKKERAKSPPIWCCQLVLPEGSRIELVFLPAAIHGAEDQTVMQPEGAIMPEFDFLRLDHKA